MPNRQQPHIRNIYIPPHSSCSAGHNASIAHLSKNEMSLIVGDINAHHSRWDTNTNEDERGEQLADKIDAGYTILNENETTRLPTNGRSTSPDISLASNDIALLSDCSVSTSLKSYLSTIDGPRRTHINFKKADWARYAEACDKYLAEAGQTRTVEQVEKTFRKAVNKASSSPPVALSASNQPCRQNADKTLNDLNRHQ